MAKNDQDTLMLDLARDVVAQTAPQELPLFQATSAAFIENPPRRGKQGEDLLGFGVGEAAVFVTPVVLAIAKEVIAYLIEEAKKTLKTESAAAVNAYIRGLFKHGKPTGSTAAPTSPASVQPVSPPVTSATPPVPPTRSFEPGAGARSA